MRYPERNKSDSSVINISDTQSIRYPSSSTTDSQDPDENESGSNVGGESNPNVATISEHVLFGNNNGHNSFLYLYYSSSTTSNNNTDNPGNIRRPYTTEGGGGGSKVSKMGSQQQWNDLSGAGARRSAHGSAGPVPKLYNDDEGEKSCNNKVYGSKGILTSSKSIDHNNDSTPYPVYLSPVEGSPVMPASPDVKKRGGHRKRSVTDNDFQKDSQSRQDSLTADLLDDDDDDDDWEKIYSAPTVPTSRYVLSPLPKEEHRRSKREESPVGHHDEQSSNTIQAKKTYNLNVSNKSSLASSASSLNKHSAITKNHHPQARTSRGSIKRVRLTPDEQPLQQAIELHRLGTSKKQWSGSGSKKMSPSTSSSSSSSIRSKRNTGSSQPQQTKSQANHQLSSNTDHVNRKCASSTLTGQDMIDQMSFRNGIGEFFGTVASRNFAKHQGPSPEELYDLEMKGWQPRLATSATIFLAVVFIASCASLLFVFPILVDPILVGFEAQFSADPVTCRTTNYRNGSGSSECAIPSCREGCTLDLFNCMFVDVEYTLPTMKHSMLTTNLKNPLTPTNITSGNDTFINASSSSEFLTVAAEGSSKNNRSAILLINVNGCGYPPEVTCSEFEKKYATVNTKFPCYYSQQNESIVVPHYSRRTETFHLILAVTIPVGLSLTSGISLYFLVRHNTALKAQIYRRYTTRRKELKEKLKEAKRREQDEEGNTSLSELEEPQDDNDNDKNNLIYQNGASKTGQEAR